MMTKRLTSMSVASARLPATLIEAQAKEPNFTWKTFKVSHLVTPSKLPQIFFLLGMRTIATLAFLNPCPWFNVDLNWQTSLYKCPIDNSGQSSIWTWHSWTEEAEKDLQDLTVFGEPVDWSCFNWISLWGEHNSNIFISVDPKMAQQQDCCKSETSEIRWITKWLSKKTLWSWKSSRNTVALLSLPSS